MHNSFVLCSLWLNYVALTFLLVNSSGTNHDLSIDVFETRTATRRRVVKGIFVARDRPFLFPVKCEMALFFFVNRDFHSRREP